MNTNIIISQSVISTVQFYPLFQSSGPEEEENKYLLHDRQPLTLIIYETSVFNIRLPVSVGSTGLL